MIRNPFETIPEEKPPEMEIASDDPEVIEIPEEEIPTLRPPKPLREILPAEHFADEVSAIEVPGFKDAKVAYTLSKKKFNRGKENPNEDAALTDPKNGLLGVFDGLGGSKGSAQASAEAKKVLPDLFRKHLLHTLLSNDEDIFSTLHKSLWERVEQRIILQNKDDNSPEVHALADQYVALRNFLSQNHIIAAKTIALIQALKDASQSIHESAPNTQTTGCVGFLHQMEDGMRYVVIGNVGDSGAFIVHKDGTIAAITEEDSLTSELLQAGQLSPEKLLAMKLDSEEKHLLPPLFEGETGPTPHGYDVLGASLTHTLGRGADNTFVSITVQTLEPGDDVIFCTDGVIDKYERMAQHGMTVQDLLEKPTDLEGMASDYRTGNTILERINTLRVSADFRASYKIEDDIAIVAAHIPEEEKDELKT